MSETTLKALAPQDPVRPAPLLPRYATSLLNRLSDFTWERRLGVRTTGWEPAGAEGERHRYGYVAYHTYFSIFDALAPGADDVIADLGCGKGRVLLAAARYPVREVVGVEIDRGLCATAAANAAAMRGRRAPIRCFCGSAADFDFDPVTIIFMFHPFGPRTMEQVLARLGESLVRRPRTVQIAYCNPIHGRILAGQPWLTLQDSWTPHAWSRIKFPVQFYRTA